MLTPLVESPLDSTPTETSRHIVIGDVHGHYEGLMHLIEFLDLNPEDELYFLGDLVDRGPQSAQVVEFVKSKGYPCLRGNHEELMIAACMPEAQDYAAFHMWAACGGRQTLESYESQEKLQDHVRWLSTLPTYIDLGNVWLVHAGVDPQKKLENQSAEEFCWIRDRFHKSSKPFFEDKLIVTGHTITFTFPQVKPGQIAQGEGWISIDTGAYHPKSGWLTAYDITQGQIFQINIFKEIERKLKLEDAIATVNPKKVKARL